ncbi:MAG TPA: hypothetical protein VK741_25490 [Acetobacteraceae bacterium]|nr:hypothetical protein [Acetobacteraceae bacterium]
MPDAEIPEAEPPPPFAIPYQPDRMRWALGVLGWSGHELARRLAMEQGSVRQMMRSANPRACPERVALWLETLAALYLRFPPPSLVYDDGEPACPAARLRYLLDRLGWSAIELGRRVSVSEHVASNWMRTRGTQQAPAAVQDWLELLDDFLVALPVPIGWARKQRPAPEPGDGSPNGTLANVDDAA